MSPKVPDNDLDELGGGRHFPRSRIGLYIQAMTEPPPDEFSRDPNDVPLQELSDRDLMRRIAEAKDRGDEGTCNDAMTEFRNRYQRMLVLIAARYLDQNQAEDVVGSTWLEFWKHCPLPEASDPRGWLILTTKREAIDLWRKRKRQPQSFPLSTDHDTDDPKALGALAILIQQERVQAVQDCLGKLGNKKPSWEVILREKMRGATLKEIADKLQITVEQIYRYTDRAKKLMKSCLEGKLR